VGDRSARGIDLRLTGLTIKVIAKMIGVAPVSVRRRPPGRAGSQPVTSSSNVREYRAWVRFNESSDWAPSVTTSISRRS
jgi:hypothetical protein